MYKRTRNIMLADPPKKDGTCMIVAAYDHSQITYDVFFAITTRIDSSNCTYLFVKTPKPKDDNKKNVQSDIFDTKHFNYSLRKITERECFRAMGLHEEDIDKLLKCGMSKTQLYKIAGNSIPTNCLSEIYSSLFSEERKPLQRNPIQLTLFDDFSGI